MRYLLLSVLVVCMIGVMIPSVSGQSDLFGRDAALNECHNRAQFLEDLDKCNWEARNRHMMETVGPLIIPLLFLVCVFAIVLSWFAFRRSRKPVKQKSTKKKETFAFCENCGNTLNPKAKFCGSCGNRI